MIDSCGELTDEMKKSGNFVSAPLTLQVDEYIVQDDEEHFNQAEFLKKVAECPNCPKSSCPSPEIYRDAYDCDADHVYAVTLSEKLSGSYNSAVLGKNLYLEDHPDAKVYVFNSCSASVGETLIGRRSMARNVLAALIGSIVYRFIYAVILKTGIVPIECLKLVTAIVVALAIAGPALKEGAAFQKRKMSASASRKGGN